MSTAWGGQQTSNRTARWITLIALLLILTAWRAYGQEISPAVSGAASYALSTEMASNDCWQHAAFDGAIVAVQTFAHTPAERMLVIALQDFASAHRKHLSDYATGHTLLDLYETLQNPATASIVMQPKCTKKRPNCNAIDMAQVEKERVQRDTAYAAVQADRAFAQAWLGNIQSGNAAQPVVK